MLHLPSALFYAFMSIFMVFSNKYVISEWEFNNPICLILLEMILNVIIIHIISRKSSISLNLGVQLESYSKYQYLIVIFYCAHSVLSLKALSGLNIPIYVMFKRCVPLVNLLISIFIFKNVNTNGNGRSIFNKPLNL